MILPPKRIRVLFDEFHSAAWTISHARAAEIQPEQPEYSSYQRAADALAARDFLVERNLDRPLTDVVADVIVLPHTCDAKWERTTGGSPRLTDDELAALARFVERGGGLLVVTEYEHDKYGDNLNELLAPFGLTIESTTVFDRHACVAGNPAWVLADVADGDPSLMHRVQQVCFYQGGSCRARPPARLALRAGPTAAPARAGLIGVAEVGRGRVAVVTDSWLFGDDHFEQFSHRQLWLNLLYWLAAPSLGRTVAAPVSARARLPAWSSLKGAINALRRLQAADGSVPVEQQQEAQVLVEAAAGAVEALRSEFGHEDGYLEAVGELLVGWAAGGLGRPDATRALGLFAPQVERRDGQEHLWVMPMYTPNASSDWRWEAVLYRVVWPAWLAELERERYRNAKLVPGALVDYTAGYASECAVLFPETAQVAGRGRNEFATIFCDREAARYQRVVGRAVQVTQLVAPPLLECFLHDGEMIRDAFALWDLIHDRAHGLGELPFDPFMIRQRAPFWMYGLEELRVDLQAFVEATRLAREGLALAEYVGLAILLDRILRFPITGPRVRNYDGLGGQLLFSYLHQRDVVIWQDNRLRVRWEALDEAVAALREELRQLYKFGADASKMNFWLAAHDLISRYVPPNVASQWRRDRRVIGDESDLRRWIELVHPDEFPLGSFHLNLARRMAG